jgi:hypothetical protein
MARFTLKREVDLGDLFTPVSILIAICALFLTWLNDRDARMKTYADNIRHSSSIVSAKLERWNSLTDRYFDDIQPVLIDVSKEVIQPNGRIPARTDLFTGLRKAEGVASQRILDEQLEISYMELYGFIPALRPPFDEIRQEIKKDEEASHRRLESTLQETLNNNELLRNSDHAMMGNALRASVKAEREKLHQMIDQTTKPLRDNMLKLIHLSDAELSDPKKRDAQILIFQTVESSQHQ